MALPFPLVEAICATRGRAADIARRPNLRISPPSGQSCTFVHFRTSLAADYLFEWQPLKKERPLIAVDNQVTLLDNSTRNLHIMMHYQRRGQQHSWLSSAPGLSSGPARVVTASSSEIHMQFHCTSTSWIVKTGRDHCMAVMATFVRVSRSSRTERGLGQGEALQRPEYL